MDYMTVRKTLRSTSAFTNNHKKIGPMTRQDFEVLDAFEATLVNISQEHMLENGFGCILTAFTDLKNPRRGGLEYALQRVQVAQGSAGGEEQQLKKIERMMEGVKEYPKFTAKLVEVSSSSNGRRRDDDIIANLESAAIEIDCANGMRGQNAADDAIVEAIDAFLALCCARNE